MNRNTEITPRTMAIMEEPNLARPLLTAMLEMLPVWVSVKDTEHRYLLVSRRRTNETGIDLTGMSTRDVPYATVEQRERTVAFDSLVLQEGRSVDVPPYEVSLPDGSRRIHMAHKSPLRDEGGGVIGVVSVVENLTGGGAAGDLVDVLEVLDDLQACRQSLRGLEALLLRGDDTEGATGEQLAALIRLVSDRIEAAEHAHTARVTRTRFSRAAGNRLR